MPSAYEDARARLFAELRRIVPQVLQFGEDEAFIPASSEDEILSIGTQTAPATGIPFLSLPEKSYRRQGPGSAIQQLHRMLRLLVRDRLWRERGGPAPSAALFRTNHLTQLLLHENKVQPQELVDSVWRSVDIHDGWSEAHEWRSGQRVPDVMRQSPAAQRPVRHTPVLLPWIAGVSLHDELYVDAVSLLPDAVLYRLTRFGPTELRLPHYGNPQLNIGHVGQPVHDINWDHLSLGDLNCILTRDLITTGSRAIFKRSTRVMVEGDYLWSQCHFDGQALDAERADFNRRIRQLFLKRSRIEATIVRYLKPFAGPSEGADDR